MPITYEVVTPTSTVSNTTTATVTFSSIPQTYTDLIVVFNGGTESGGSNVQFKINNDAGSNYSFTVLRGDGTTVNGDRESNQTVFRWGDRAIPSAEFSTVDFAHLMNYTNTTTYKTLLFRTHNASGGIDAAVGRYASTSAINRIDITIPASAYFKNGSTITIYGIKAA